MLNLFWEKSSQNTECGKPNGMLKKTMNTFIPFGEIPKAMGKPGNYNWINYDSEDVYKSNIKKGKIPSHGPNDISYKLNSLGYRGDEFKKRKFNIACFGSSWVFGEAVPQSSIFHEIIKNNIQKKLNCVVSNWNFGQSGASNDWIARMVCHCVPILNPDLVLVNFTYLSRREFIDVNGCENRFVVSQKGYNLKTSKGIERSGYPVESLSNLISPHDDIINIYKCYNLVKLSCLNTNLLFSTEDSNFEHLGNHIDHKKYIGIFKKIDLGRDMVHPGEISHRTIAELYLERLEA